MSAANTNAARPTFFQTHGGASAFALRCARQGSPTGRASRVEFVANTYQAFEGGLAFEAASAAPSDDYTVRELPAAELTRRQQSGMRAAVASLHERADAHDLAVVAAITKPVKAMHASYAAECREEAREIEMLLTVAGVRRVGPEPVTSSERDSRVEFS